VQILLGIPISIIVMVIQLAVISRLNIAYGIADITMLSLIAWSLHSDIKNVLILMVFNGVLMSLVSATPLYSPLIGYAAIVGIALFFRKRLWNIPMVLMVILSFIGTIITLGLSMFAINFSEAAIPLGESFTQIILPSAAMNMVIGIPIFLILRDIWLNFYSEEIE